MKLFFLAIITGLFMNSSIAQSVNSFYVNLSGGLYLLSTELQLEFPLVHYSSIGVKMRNYHKGTKDFGKNNDGYSVISSEPTILQFKGNMLEVFGRQYIKKDQTGNTEGWFGQIKVGFGSFQNPLFSHEIDHQTKQNYTNRTFNTLGGGIGIGNKFRTKYFTIELYGGLRFYTPPKFERSTYFQLLNYYGDEEFGRNSWYINRSFPLEFNLRFGFQI